MALIGRFWIWVTVLFVLAGVSPVLGDVLVTVRGTRYKGKVTEQWDGSYVLETPARGTLKFPKNLVAKVITEADVKPQYEAMLHKADLSKDADLDRLSKFTDENGLFDEQQALLARAYSLRHSAAQGKQEALRALAVWCRQRGLGAEASTCEVEVNRSDYAPRLAAAGQDPVRLRELVEWCRAHHLYAEAESCTLKADRSDFGSRFATAGNDTARLEELAKWCLERGLEPEAAKCLEPQYVLRSRRALGPLAKWELADWCQRWKREDWRHEQRAAAIAGASGAGDQRTLLQFLEGLETETPAGQLRVLCARAIYRLRSGAAQNNAMEQVQLAQWCAAHGLNEEEAAAKAAALNIAPDDPTVRETLGYAKERGTGRWVVAPKCAISGPWKFTVLSVWLTDSYRDKELDVVVKSTKPDVKIAVMEVRCEALRGYAAGETPRTTPDGLSQRLLHETAAGGNVVLNNESFVLLTAGQLSRSPTFDWNGVDCRLICNTGADGTPREYVGWCKPGNTGTATLAFPVAAIDRQPTLIFAPTSRLEEAKVGRISIQEDGRFRVTYSELGDLSKSVKLPGAK